jgi:hypothetical protein
MEPDIDLVDGSLLRVLTIKLLSLSIGCDVGTNAVQGCFAVDNVIVETGLPLKTSEPALPTPGRNRSFVGSDFDRRGFLLR